MDLFRTSEHRPPIVWMRDGSGAQSTFNDDRLDRLFVEFSGVESFSPQRHRNRDPAATRDAEYAARKTALAAWDPSRASMRRHARA